MFMKILYCQIDDSLLHSLWEVEMRAYNAARVIQSLDIDVIVKHVFSNAKYTLNLPDNASGA